MKKKEAPVFSIADYCTDKEIRSIKVSSFSEEACTNAEIETDHRQEYFEIVWLKKGSGHHLIDTISHPYSGSVLFLLSPGQLHRIFPKDKAEGYVIKFLPSLFSDAKDLDEYLIKTGLFDNIQSEPIVKVNASLHTVLEDVLKKMETEFNAEEDDKEKIMLAYLKILITHIGRLKKIHFFSQEHAVVDANFSLFQRYKTEVERNFKTEHRVQAYANRLGTPARTINTITKKFTGKTAGEIIAGRLALEAKRELYHNNRSVKEIGFDLGFESPAYFTRFFKKQTGTSPFEYKQSLAHENHALASVG
ncbi:MAG TPA: helix-turn-helix domain-containing protein [Cyclobacteriaceae bacterium]|nr:helix-turn-helix domain-containing protein [Cyclobacteriaceae bacterium]